MVYSLEIQTKLTLYKSMKLIRCVEEEIAIRYPEGKMRCPTHLSIGQEIAPSILSVLLSKEDFCVSTHRGHAHYIAKGGNLKNMIAEIYGKSTGCSKGKGGSMHLADINVNFMGTSAIVGNSIPVGVGLGLAANLKQTGQISCIYLGDAATEEGVFYESINFAAVKKLPVLLVCENNLYSVYSSMKDRQPKNRKIHEMVQGIGVKSFKCEGAEIDKAFNVFSSAVESVRNGEGPSFIEISTYRWREHCGPNFDNDIGYRTEEEFDAFFKLDPLNNLYEHLLSTSANGVKICEKIDEEIHRLVTEAFDFAENSPFPQYQEAFLGIYSK